MFHKLSTLIAVGLGAKQVLCYSHGELGDVNGNNIRWQELAEGVFTGVPAENWDDKIHKRGFQELDIEEIMSMKRDYLETGKSNLELEARDLPATCQAAVNCAKTVGGAVGEFTLHAASYAFFETAAFIANYGPDPKPIMEFLNQPFVANAAGVAVAGVISGQINEATKKECSSTGNEIDALKAAIDAGLNQGNSGATSISVTVKGQAGSFTVDMTVRPLGESPAPKCFEA